MNRRNFFKSAASFAALLGINPDAIIEVEPVSHRYHSKEWWKHYFNENTQESPLEQSKVKKRYSSDETCAQIFGFSTDTQIDTLPDGRGTFLIFRLRYSIERKDNEIPTIKRELVRTPILLE